MGESCFISFIENMKEISLSFFTICMSKMSHVDCGRKLCNPLTLENISQLIV